MEDRNNEIPGGAPAEETASPVEADAAETDVTETDAAGTPPTGEKPPKFSEGLKKALIRCGVALVIVIALLGATRFSIAAIIKGPANTSAISNEKDGAFIRRDIYAIVGYSDSDRSGEAVVGEYAIVPMDGKFVTVHLPRRFLNSADAVLEETKNYISDSSSTTLDKYFVVDGTVGKLSDAEQKKLAAWYASNKDWLVENHVIDKTADETSYLSDTVLEVDKIGSMSQIMVIVLSGIAGAFLIYLIVELILMACGFYLDDRVKARLAKADARLLAGLETEQGAADTEAGTDAGSDAEPESESGADTEAEPAAAPDNADASDAGTEDEK